MMLAAEDCTMQIYERVSWVEPDRTVENWPNDRDSAPVGGDDF